ncbi:MAG: chloride channel protein [Phycisphaeraceae bacterium]|nr:chloride channel protein [Phycisphaeraceae bacterium]
MSNPSVLQRLRKIIAQPESVLIAIGAIVGTLTGLSAVAFAEALHKVEDLSQGLQRGMAGFGPGWMWVVLAPVIGMGLTGVLVYFFASEAKGHGVPQVMTAIIQKGGVMRARAGLVKVFASILTVGSGGSGGTEGPIVQIGSVLGSWVGQKLRVDRQQLMTLVGCGAAAGISSIFNAPIAGVFFVLEILLRDFSVRTFTPIVVSSVFSAVTTQAVLGRNQAIFTVDQMLHDTQFRVVELPSFVLLGLVCGLVAVGFNRTLHAIEDVYERIRIHPLLKPITGAVLLGLMGLAFLEVSRASGVVGDSASIPAIFGNGYSTIRHLLEPGSYTNGSPMATALVLAAMLIVFKAIATSVTLASGGSGGVFAPSLFLGAAAGAGLGTALDGLNLLPGSATPASYALVGMAAVVGASMHGPLTAILILFELTRNFSVVLPIMLAAVVATTISQVVDRDSIYTTKLRRQGVLLGGSRDLTIMRGIAVSSVQRVPLPSEPIYASDPLSKLITLHANHHVPDFVVVDAEGRYMGMVTGADMRTALIDREAIPLLLVAELLRSDLPTIVASESLATVMDKFAEHDVASLCLLDPASPDKPLALITRSNVIKRYHAALGES